MTRAPLLSSVLALAACAPTAPPAGSPAAPGAARGPVLHAVGQEPGWTLTVAPGREVVFVTDYGQRRVAAADPRETAAGGRTVYTATTDAGALRVVATETPCADAMSGAPYPLTVTVTLAGETVSGCGRRGG